MLYFYLKFPKDKKIGNFLVQIMFSGFVVFMNVELCTNWIRPLMKRDQTYFKRKKRNLLTVVLCMKLL